MLCGVGPIGCLWVAGSVGLTSLLAQRGARRRFCRGSPRWRLRDSRGGARCTGWSGRIGYSRPFSPGRPPGRRDHLDHTPAFRTRKNGPDRGLITHVKPRLARGTVNREEDSFHSVSGLCSSLMMQPAGKHCTSHRMPACSTIPIVERRETPVTDPSSRPTGTPAAEKLRKTARCEHRQAESRRWGLRAARLSVRPGAYIFSTTRIPNRWSPCRIIRAVRSHSNRRLVRTSSPVAFSTGHCS